MQQVSNSRITATLCHMERISPFCVYDLGSNMGAARIMPSGGDEFREQAKQCRGLAARLKEAEHRSFAMELANGWIALAEWVERKAAVPTEAILIIAQSASEDQKRR